MWPQPMTREAFNSTLSWFQASRQRPLQAEFLQLLWRDFQRIDDEAFESGMRQIAKRKVYDANLYAEITTYFDAEYSPDRHNTGVSFDEWLRAVTRLLYDQTPLRDAWALDGWLTDQGIDMDLCGLFYEDCRAMKGFEHDTGSPAPMLLPTRSERGWYASRRKARFVA